MARPADPNAKEALVAAARAEFARKGLVGARIEDITSACGLSKGAFYLHFPSKEALFGELVEAFLRFISECDDRREKKVAAFFTEHGPITRRDQEERSAKYRAYMEIETAEDREVLEHMWAYRDVVGVLLRGAQGTKFEGAIWEITEREIEPIKENIHRVYGENACRTDVPPEIFGSLIVGTYVLLGMRMSRMTEKPDLAEWARSLHALIHEGSLPPSPSPEDRPSRSQS